MPSGFSIDAAGQATGEGFGIAYLEAAMAGRASIGALFGGQQDLIIDGETGWLVDLESLQLPNVIRQLQNNVELLAASGCSASDRARRQFSVQAQYSAMRQFFVSY
jgi:glycosyltransferase involved in cell wall biosynthesis